MEDLKIEREIFIDYYDDAITVVDRSLDVIIMTNAEAIDLAHAILDHFKEDTE